MKLLATDLDEGIKWRKPCYSADGANGLRELARANAWKLVTAAA